MAYVNESSWRQMHLNRLRYLYGNQAKAWDGKYTDDRAVFCRTYRAMEAALRSLPAEPLNYVAVAMNQKLKEDRQMLDRILRKVRDRDLLASREAEA